MLYPAKSGPDQNFGSNLINATIPSLGYKKNNRAAVMKMKDYLDEARSSSNSSKLSTLYFERILDTLRMNRYKGTTEHNYHQIWTQFNDFLIQLDRMPETWEDRLIIHITSLVQAQRQPQTISSYISAIKVVLRTENIIITDEI